MHQLTPATRGKRLMQRIHTLQSEDGGSAGGDSFDDLDFPSVHHDEEEENPTSSEPADKNLLFVPGFHELKLGEGEKPPHEKDAVEKIKMRARSQSWMIRTTKILHEAKARNKSAHINTDAHLLFRTFHTGISIEPILLEYQRAVIFRVGRLIKSGTKGPGLFFILPCIDTCKIVSAHLYFP
ncbi:unnamed protein product [Cylicostephanus goldi]|uniref:Uncharacterized protein n=1 Tax=Cylicostephanus goldi TaxID=71465 RepID=A0A3P7PRN6_CYLGO|nr:unnamed protein product [Cylicostephanus goldi]